MMLMIFFLIAQYCADGTPLFFFFLLFRIIAPSPVLLSEGGRFKQMVVLKLRFVHYGPMGVGGYEG